MKNLQWTWLSKCLGYMPKSDKAALKVGRFQIFRKNFPVYFQDGCTNCSDQQWWRVHLTLYPLKHYLSLVILNLVIQKCRRWNLKVVLVWISLMAQDVEYFCKWFWAWRGPSKFHTGKWMPQSDNNENLVQIVFINLDQTLGKIIPDNLLPAYLKHCKIWEKVSS